MKKVLIMRILSLNFRARYNKDTLERRIRIMNNEDELKMVNLLNDGSPNKHPSTYDLLVRQSKKLGSVATTTLHDMKNILNHEIALPHAGQFLNNFPKTASARKQRELEAALELKKAVKKSHEVLALAQTVFPIDLFPDSIVVDRTKISLTKRTFFWTSNTISFQIEDVLNVSCGIGPMFGSLTIASRVMSSVDHYQINYLWRADAIFLKHLIQGHIIAKNSKLATDHLTVEEVIETLCELGIDSDV